MLAQAIYHKEKNEPMIHLRLLALLLLPLSLAAQNGMPASAGARGLAMGQTGLTFADINSIFSNQAGLAFLEGPAFLAFAEQRFMLEELQSFSFGGALPTSTGTFGLSLNHFGFDDYNEQRVGLAYARRLFSRVALGAQFLMLNTRIPEYGNKAAFTFELGALLELIPQLEFGVHLFSPARVEVAPEEYLPSVLRMGLRYFPSNSLNLLAEVEKDLDHPVRVKMGAEYKAAEPLALRFGMATQPVALSFGVGYRLPNGLGLDVASSYHQLLGFTPAAGLNYQLNKSSSADEDINRRRHAF